MGNTQNEKRNHHKELKFLRDRGWFRIGMCWFVSERLGKFPSGFKSESERFWKEDHETDFILCAVIPHAGLRVTGS